MFAVKGADMPAPGFARLRHVVNNRDVSRNWIRNRIAIFASRQPWEREA
jgi:hypothetical protein